MKISHIITSMAVLGIMAVGTAYAAPQNPLGSGRGYAQTQASQKLEGEELAAWNKLHEQHIKEVAPIRETLNARKMELNALKNNTQVSPNYVRDLTEEIVNLQAKDRELNAEFREEAKEKFGIDVGPRKARDGRGQEQGRGQGQKHDKGLRDGQGNGMGRGYINAPCNGYGNGQGMYYGNGQGKYYGNAPCMYGLER